MARCMPCHKLSLLAAWETCLNATAFDTSTGAPRVTVIQPLKPRWFQHFLVYPLCNKAQALPDLILLIRHRPSLGQRLSEAQPLSGRNAKTCRQGICMVYTLQTTQLNRCNHNAIKGSTTSKETLHTLYNCQASCGSHACPYGPMAHTPHTHTGWLQLPSVITAKKAREPAAHHWGVGPW